MRIKTIIFSFIAISLSLLVLEALARLLVKPSAYCYGTFLRLELPPCNLKYFDLPKQPLPAKPTLANKPKNNSRPTSPPTSWTANGKRLANDDLAGALIAEPVLGYSFQKNYTSTNAWWQSNNLGARNRKDTSAEIPSGKKRIIVFGDSLTNCRGVPQEESWPYIMEQNLARTEVLNFGVNGYSMTQAFLRFQKIADLIDYDTVIFVFPPSDLSREINVSACCKKWQGCQPMPRFILNNQQLLLVPSPYPDVNSFYRENDAAFSNTFLHYLRRYDRYYFPFKYERTSFFGKSVVFKIISSAILQIKEKSLDAQLMRPGSEAFQITKALFSEAHRVAQKEGKRFILAILPTQEEIRQYKTKNSYREKWSGLSLHICPSGAECLDLMDVLKDIPEENLDTTIDGTHYGFRANQVIAKILLTAFK